MQNDTYGCIGDPRGGLVAGPRCTASYEEPLFFTADTDYMPSGEIRMVVTGMHNLSPVGPESVEGVASLKSSVTILTDETPDIPDFTFVQLHYYADPDGGGAYDWFAETIGYKFFRDVPSSVVVASQTQTGFTTGRYYYGYGGVAVGRTVAQGGTASDLGEIAVATVVSSSERSPGSFGIYLYPNLQIAAAGSTRPSLRDGVVNLNSIKSTQDPYPAGSLIVHQGRVLAHGSWNFVNSTPDSGLTNIGAAGTVLGGERVIYSPDNDWLTTSVFNANVYVPERPFGIGAMASNNASELFVVKMHGGGFVIRGDLDTPTIIRLPGLPATGIASNIPAVSPIGLVYGSNRSVWLWGGGTTVEDIAPQLDGWFWKPGDVADQMPGPALLGRSGE